MKTSNDHSILRELLKAYRLKLGVTQEELSKILGRPQSYVSKFESGEKKLDVFELREVCVAMNLHFLSFIKELEVKVSNASK